MQEFDPRRPAFRLAPRLMMGIAGCCALALGWRLTGAEAHLPTEGMRSMDAARVANLESRAFAEAAAQPGLAPAQNIEVKVLPGETFEAAVRRLGVGPDDARAAVGLLAGAFDVVNIRAGLAFQAAVAAPREERGPVRLVGLSMRTGPATALTISRTFDGALHLRELAEDIHEETTVAQGSIEGSLYETAAEQGSTSAITSQAAKLFAHKIDFSRDIQDGDTFKLVFTRKVTESGRTVEGGDLLYAEVDAGKGDPIRFYRYQPKGGGEAQYFDENGKSIRGFLLQTPIAVVRITSGFGMRFHPVLGYNKVHQGIDFGGAVGTPIYAAGDGVVEQAGPNGGYGNWVKLKHSEGWETGYAHMSRFAPGLHRGQSVKQGQLIGYVGATGRVTGPHLHYEVMKNGVKINPKGAKVPAGSILAGAELADFRRQKAIVDVALAKADNAPVQVAANMRPAQVASR